MDVIFWIIRWVVLYNPVNVWEIKTSLSNISAQENASFSLSKLKICGGSLLLLLFTVDVFDRNIYVIEQVTVELDCIATAHENHYLFLEVLFKEGK